jgi:mono/diheme cytochrome c family protein
MLLKRICWVFILAITAAISLHAAPTVAAGKELFTANCAACHNKNMKDAMTGPALGGVEDRWSAFPKKDLYSWIRNSQSLIATGQPRAVELWSKYKPTIMSPFPGLTDEQIESVLLYVKDAAIVKVDGAKTPVEPTEKEAETPWMFIGMVLLLGLLAFAMMRIIDNLGNVSRVQAGQQPINKSWVDTLNSKGFIAFMVFAVVLVLGYKTVDNATTMGREQGYQPDQPIKFSHKLHAGTNKIDCQYCHDGARRSKQATIPGTNTCMNCHAAVKKGSKTGTSEITKIFASIGFDPMANKYIPEYDKWSDKQIEDLYKKWIGQEYLSTNNIPALDENGHLAVDNEWEGVVKALKNDSNGKIQGPIEWTRVHNLPDHVYFPHANHVAVGQIDCQKCHGPVPEMDVVYQYSTLGMGWCISCHRETEVKFKENPYYAQYERYHKEIKEGKRDKVTVAEIGGLECQKCHY